MIGTIIGKMKTKKSFDYLNKKDVSSFIADWAVDAVLEYPGDFEESGEIKGKKAIEEWYQKYLEQFPKIKLTLKNICVKKIFDLTGTNVICAESEIEVTNKNEESYKYSEMTVITLKSRKAIHVRDYIFDMESLRKAWGK